MAHTNPIELQSIKTKGVALYLNLAINKEVIRSLLRVMCINITDSLILLMLALQHNVNQLYSIVVSHYLFNELAVSQLDLVWRVKCGDNFTASHEGQPLNAIEVGVLNCHNTSVGKQLLRVVVDKLSEIKNVPQYIYITNSANALQLSGNVFFFLNQAIKEFTVSIQLQYKIINRFKDW